MEISKKANGTENLHYAVTLANLAKVVRFLVGIVVRPKCTVLIDLR